MARHFYFVLSPGDNHSVLRACVCVFLLLLVIRLPFLFVGNDPVTFLLIAGVGTQPVFFLRFCCSFFCFVFPVLLTSGTFLHARK